MSNKKPTTKLTNFMTEIAAQEHRKQLARNRKRAQRSRTAAATGGPSVFVQIELTSEEAALLRMLQEQARDPKDFRKLALLQGAKFRANTGRGAGKFRRGGQ